MFKLVLVTILLPVVLSESFNYRDSKLYQVVASNEEHVKVLAQLQKNLHVDILNYLRVDVGPISVIVNEFAQSYFEKTLEKNFMKFKILSNNVESDLRNEFISRNITSRSTRAQINFEEYHKYNEINSYLDILSVTHADLVTIEVIGQSYEGRALKVVKISTNSSANKPVIFIDAGFHAAEWLAPPVALYVIKQLVEKPENKHFLANVDWHILPMLNPDGYEYSHKFFLNRLWRKTRSPVSPFCNGVDPNRNFDFHWNESDLTNIKCLPIYRGEHPFSEKETIAFRDYILQHKNSIKLYLTLHTFGSLILYPWGYTKDLPEDNEELLSLGNKVADSISSVRGTQYKVGTTANALYSCTGISPDWVKGVAGINLCYTLELPAGGLFGFTAPPSDIWPTVTETWEGIRTFHEHIENNFS